MNVERSAFRISIAVGAMKGLVCGAIPFPLWQDKPPSVILGVFVVTITIGVAGEHLLFYSNNMDAHRKLLLVDQEAYLRKLNGALSRIGLRRMLQKHWFVAEFKKHVASLAT